jgi:hypothetical protein
MNPYCRERKINFITWKYGKIYNTKELYSIVSYKNIFKFNWGGRDGNMLFLDLSEQHCNFREPVIKYVKTNLPATYMFIRSFDFKKEENKIFVADTPNFAINHTRNIMICFSHGLILIGLHNKTITGNEIDPSDQIMMQYIVPLFETYFRQKIISDTPFSNPIRSGVYKKLIVRGEIDSLGNYFSVGTDGENLIMEKTIYRRITAASYYNHDWDKNSPVEVEMKKISYTRHNDNFYIQEEKINKEEKDSLHHFNCPSYTIFKPKNKIIFYYFEKIYDYKKTMKISFSHEDFDDWCDLVNEKIGQ